MSKIVITDLDFDDFDVERELAQAAGIELAFFQDRSPEAIIEHLEGADAALTSYGSYTRAVFEAHPQLKAVCKTGTGVDNIDVAAATDHGVAVCNVPGYGTEVVSDHAVTLALGVLRRINELDAALRAGTWSYQDVRPLGQCKGRVFGVVGMGAIGRAAARKAAGLGFEVVCCSRSLEPGTTTPQGFAVVAYEELLARADVVSFHVALTPETHHMLDAAHVALMKPDAVVVNTSRGEVVDTDAVARALTEGRLWGAGFDVFSDEPVHPDDALFDAPHTLLTPHVAYWSEESGRELRSRAMGNLIAVITGEGHVDRVN